uniref:HAT C-terminal dimerisation domain-containing protein n=1 Tax=Acanthochromis polyacanthus TaxID=80966 RepID=A0A3Q1GW72_9TELE
MVINDIKEKYENADYSGFCLKSDGTRDKCNVENMSVMIRFVRNGIPEEHLIGLLDLSQLNAEYITTQILEHLSESGYNAAEIMSQCYDGASVMSGVKGGVQALIQKKIGKDIPYIHCYNHQLHLVVVHAMQAEPCAKAFFDLSGSLHSFFHRHYMSQNYDVPSLKRLLEIRWTSHYEVTKCLVENQDAIMSILTEVTEDRAAAVDICTEASGLLMMLRRHNFFEIGKFLLKILGPLKPANAMLQGHSVDLCCASELVSASLQTLKQIRHEQSEALTSTATPAAAAKRQRTMSSQLTGSVVMSTLGHEEDSVTPDQALKRALLNILDTAIVEMETRFTKSNLDLMKAVNCLQPQSISFLDPAMLGPLQKMAGCDSGTLSNEILVGKIMLENKFKNTEEGRAEFVNLSTICQFLQGHKEGFPQLHRMYVTSIVIGISSASCESSFSTLSRVLTPFRRTMLHKRKRDLVILAHEKAITKGLNMDEFVRVFAQKNRRLILK